MSIVSSSVRRPVTTLMVFLAVVVIGVFCLFQFPIDQLPEADVPSLTVMTVYEGAAPEDVENKVTKVLEDALAALPDLKHITSVSSEGLSRIILSFEWQTDLDTRANDARDAIDKARMFLPSEIDPPRVLKLNLADFPILIYGVRAKESFPALEKLLKDHIADPLKRVPGVALVAPIVPLTRQVNVYADRERLAAHGLTVQDLTAALARENQDIPVGNIKTGDTDYLVRVPGEFREAQAMLDVVVAVRDGRPIRLRDVATVEDHFKEPTEYVTVDGMPGAAIVIRKQSGANTVKVARAVRKRLPELQRALPRDIEFVPVMDASEDIQRMISNLVQTLWMGAGLAVLVVLLFLRRWRATAIIALAIPYSLLIALGVIYFLGYTINIMTLFGFIIAVGMVVDNAIVILENITRHREDGERPIEAAIYGTTEVGLAVAASTLTSVCIFFPILFIRGITRVFFTQFAVVASIALLGSLFSAMTLTPMLSAVLLCRERFDATERGRLWRRMECGFEALENGYVRLLEWALTHRKTVILAAAVLLILSLISVPRLGTEFMPKEDQNTVRGTIYMPVGTRVETTFQTMQRISELIHDALAPEERVAVFTRCGQSTGFSAAFQTEGSHIGTFSIRLVAPEHRRRSDKEIAAKLRERLGVVRAEWGIERFVLETSDMTNMLVLGGERPLTINILGDDLVATDALAEEIRSIVARIPGAVDVAVSREKARPELEFEVDRAKAAELGLNVGVIGAAARQAVFGATASKFRVGGDEYDIVVRLREEDRSAPEDIERLPLRLPQGRLVRAEQIGRLQRAFGPVQIDRKDQTRVVSVTGDVVGRSLGEVTREIETALQRVTVPAGVEVRLAGQTEEQRESFLWLSLALAIGTVLTYMVMAAQFESLKAPFIVMFSVPFAFTGVIGSLWLRGYNVNVITFLGLLMLVGTVVNNAIVLVDYTNILRARGLPPGEAIRQAGRTRLRPVLMTALTTIVALIPMALQKGQGSEVWNPLGTTVAGGLLVSTLVTLVLVPTIYSLFHGRGWQKEHPA